MNAEERARILSEARDTVERISLAEREWKRQRANVMPDDSRSDYDELRARSAVLFPPRREAQRTQAEVNEQRERDWNTWARTIVQGELGLFADGLGQEIAETVTAPLKAEIASLRREVEELRSVQRGLDSGSVQIIRKTKGNDDAA
jgi:hypothetical protein